MGHNGRMRMRFLVAALVGLTFTSSAVAQAQTVTIQLISFTTLTTQHDTPPKGKGNKGDSIDFKDLLLNDVARQFGKKKGKAVGYDAGIVRYTSATRQEMLVRATFPGVGTITFQGVMEPRSNGDVVLPITGGTGGFKGARGTVTIGSGDQKAPNTYRVTVPGTVNIYGPGGVA